MTIASGSAQGPPPVNLQVTLDNLRVLCAHKRRREKYTLNLKFYKQGQSKTLRSCNNPKSFREFLNVGALYGIRETQVHNRSPSYTLILMKKKRKTFGSVDFFKNGLALLI